MPSRLVSPPCDFAQATVASRSANSSVSVLALTIGNSFWQILDLGQVDAVGFGAEIIIRRDRKRAEMTDAACDVLDPLVQAEDFHADQNDRRICHVGRAREIDRHVAAGDRDRGLPSLRPLVSVLMASARTGPAASV